MATYYEKARTNYFKVKDPTEFQKFIDKFNGIDLVVEEKKGGYALLFDEETGIPCCYYDDDGNDVEVDFVDEVSTHLTDDSIAVFEAVGSEKYRYLSGYAIAVNSEGKQVRVDINDIYARAKAEFGVEKISEANY